MKGIRILLFFGLLASNVAVNALSPPPSSNPGHHYTRRGHIDTPLDGGILAILGVAGIVYFLSRKKGNKKEL
jgi:hypothetical protein